MALPYSISNGDLPDATKLMANFNWLAAGKGIRTGTLAALKTLAATDTATPFLCVATMDDGTAQLMCYMGYAALGDGGFITIGGGANSTTEVG